MKTIVKTATIPEFFRRGRQVARAVDRGTKVVARRVISFEDPLELAAVITAKRLALFLSVSGEPGSVRELAARLRRSPRTISKDVKLFERLEIFVVEPAELGAHPGRRVVRATTKSLDIRCVVGR